MPVDAVCAGRDAVPNNHSRGRWLHRYAILVVVATWFLIFAGGMVTSTGSGLSVPDWPTTYGQNMFTYPPSKWVGGIFYEHGHRLIASTVGMLTVGLCIWLWIREPRRWLAWLGVVALAAVIAQGVLGGLTVKYLLPTPVSVSHACLAQTFFCIVISIAIFTSPSWVHSARVNASEQVETGIQTPRLLLFLVGVIFVQLILGAIMRHTESGLAVLDFPTTFGKWIPDLSDSAIGRYNDYRRFERLMPAVTVEQVGYHVAHRMWAIVVAMSALGVCATVLRRHGKIGILCRGAWLILALIVVQIALGAWTVLSEKRPVAASLHVAMGAATLATAWFMTVQAYRRIGIAKQIEMPNVAVAGAAT